MRLLMDMARMKHQLGALELNTMGIMPRESSVKKRLVASIVVG